MNINMGILCLKDYIEDCSMSKHMSTHDIHYLPPAISEFNV